MTWRTCVAISIAMVGVATPARAVDAPAVAADRAAYATEAELGGDGLPHTFSVATLGRYGRGENDANIVDFVSRSRACLGSTLGYCIAFDGNIGGSSAGLVYGVAISPVGFGLRWGPGNIVTVTGGLGYDRLGDAVPGALFVPAELSIGVALGPLRPVAWVRPQWIASEEARRKGSNLGFVDELDLGLLVRLSPQHRYWSTTFAGGGLALGVGYREFMGTFMVTGLVGIALDGGK